MDRKEIAKSYFARVTGLAGAKQAEAIEATVLKAYRWQYIVSGVMEPRFQKLLASLNADC